MKTPPSTSWVVGAISLLVATPSLLAGSFVKNPSFENNYNDVWPHYGSIDDWTGGSGVNEAAGPFHNGPTPIPDQTRAGFMQGSKTLSQEITGLTPGKQYWIQFYYDARNCCGGTIDLITKFNDVELDKVPNVKPATGGKPYYARSVPFKAEADAGTLAFATVASGDATVNLDAVTIVERDTNNVPVINPSFEASGVAPDTGVVASIAGWTGTGVFGVNPSGAGPFADNGVAPDQDLVAFLQGASALSQTVANLGVGKSYQLTFAYNAKSGNKPHLQLKVGEATVFEEDVNPVGAANAYRTKTVTFTASDTQLQITFAQTKEGDQTLLIDDVRLVGETQKPLPPLGIAPNKAELGPGQKVTVAVTVPTELLAIKAAAITLRSPNSAVARIVNADADGAVTLQYQKGGTNVQKFEIEAVARGVARVDVVDSAGLALVNDISINVTTSFVRNPSFESSPAPAGVGYGEILTWTGGSGLNKSTGPFHDNGEISDRDQIAFLQGSKTMSQEIAGLRPGRNYWLQFRYNVRNCCAGGTADLTVKFDGKTLVTLPKIAAVGGQNPYLLHNAAFTPASSSGLLEFTSAATGDATVLLDAVTIVQREPGQIVVQNPSFEASGSPVGVGYIQPRKISGWDMTGGYGVNITGVGPFTDNGAAPDQDLVLFLQGAASASQNITGLTPGGKYTLAYSVNARNCCGAGVTRYNVSFADEQLLEEEIEPVRGAEPYLTRYLVFTANAAEGILRFQGTPEGDHTLLLDDVRILPGVVEAPPPSVPMGITKAADGSIRISWPSTAADFVLQSSDGVAGPWTNAGISTTTEANEFVATIPKPTTTRFYRLRK
ncbi:MAG: DUF642 domain-containing protein [Verrucomicrobia bacterium]|nr:DUF642 domain-containing protein [Verrucomicrobiota bacterium]